MLVEPGKTLVVYFVLALPFLAAFALGWTTAGGVSLLRVLVGLVVLVLVLLTVFSVSARDLEGRFASSPLKPWFDKLASGKGPCCSDADGTALSDVDWRSFQGHYQVRLDVSPQAPEVDLEWIDVPDEAVLTVPNLAGRTMVWPVRVSPLGGRVQVTIRCFLPGPGM